jgi:alpha-ribazole phosphatase
LLSYVILRHPPVGVQGRCYGRLEVPAPFSDGLICDMWAALLRDLQGVCPEQVCVWTSPLGRCGRLARRWVELLRLGDGPLAFGASGAALPGSVVLHEVPALMEMDFGRWEGVAWDGVPRRELDAWAVDLWDAAPWGGECVRDVWERVQAFRQGQLEPFLSLDVLHVVITHGGVLKLWDVAAGAALAPTPGFAPSYAWCDALGGG